MRKKVARKATIMMAGLALLASTGFASTLYVDARKGNNGNDGTALAPWQTVQKAADCAQPGDTVLVAEGDYSERIHVTRSGAPDRPVTFEASGRAVTQGFTITADYIRVVGFEITNHITLPRESYGVYLHGQHDEILNNYLHDLYHDGIMLAGEGDPNSPRLAHNLIKGNRIYRANNSGIHVEGRENLIEDNDVSHTSQYPPGGPAWDGADADGMRFLGTGHIFRGNRIHDITFADLGNLDPHIDCWQSWGPATDITFEQNLCDLDPSGGRGGQASMVDNSTATVSHLLYRNNIFMDCGPLNIHNKTADESLTFVQVLNNTFYHIATSAIELTGVRYATVENNAFYDVGSHRQSYLGHVGASAGSQEGWVVGYNFQSMSDGQPPGKAGSQAPYPHDLWGIDPKFVDAAGKDLRPTANSPLVGSGAELQEVKTDFTGAPRPQGAGYDIGAYEYKR
jgi:hypothetical protein